MQTQDGLLEELLKLREEGYTHVMFIEGEDYSRAYTSEMSAMLDLDCMVTEDRKIDLYLMDDCILSLLE